MMKDRYKKEDHMAMLIAIDEAKKAFDEQEVPVGAVLFIDGKLIAKAHNQVERCKDASMHAELICLKMAAKVVGDFRLSEATLYSTLEPCAMCAGAMYSFRIKKLIYGARDLRVGACGTLYNLFDQKHPITTIEVIGGLMEEESAALMKSFFKKIKKEKNGRGI